MKKYCKLIMVSQNNNNKFYEMKWDGLSTNFYVEFGRVQSTNQKTSYPIALWNRKYNEKISKGYKDITHTVQEEVLDVNEDFTDIKEKKVNDFLLLMKRYTDGLVSKIYSVKAASVTKKQVDNAQGFINLLKKTKKNNTVEINKILQQLYMEIPRYMSDVRENLLPNIDLKETIQAEQDNLDAMAMQVRSVSSAKDGNKRSLLDVLEISMKEGNINKDLKYITDQLNGRNFSIFEVQKKKHEEIFNSWMKGQKDKKTRFLIHGTRCSSVFPIMEQGLLIRPTGNYQFSGKVYGDGNYFSETCSKSLNYTGSDSDKVLLIYEVHVGNPFIYNGWYKGNSFTLNYQNLKDRGFDSTFVKAAGGLLNTEIIVYKEEQAVLKYIIHLK